MFQTPILLLIFNRLDTTKELFKVLQILKPIDLFIVSDGPRLDKENENHLVQEVRDFVVENVNWRCNLHTLFR